MAKRARSLRSRFSGDQRGAAALEFAMLALPFILAMLAIFEYGYVFIVQVSLDNATAEAARQIRTGQALTYTTVVDPTSGKSSTLPMTRTDFIQLVCKNAQWVNTSDCTVSLKASAEPQTGWTSQSATPPVVNGNLSTTLPFSLGSANQVVLVHTYYPWTMITPAIWGPSGGTLSGNKVLLTSATLIANEPF